MENVTEQFYKEHERFSVKNCKAFSTAITVQRFWEQSMEDFLEEFCEKFLEEPLEEFSKKILMENQREFLKKKQTSGSYF